MGIGSVGPAVSRPLYDSMLYNVACCHPERSEGSLIQRTNQSDSFTLIIVQRFFGQCPQNDRIIVCWHKNGVYCFFSSRRGSYQLPVFCGRMPSFAPVQDKNNIVGDDVHIIPINIKQSVVILNAVKDL